MNRSSGCDAPRLMLCSTASYCCCVSSHCCPSGPRDTLVSTIGPAATSDTAPASPCTCASTTVGVPAVSVAAAAPDDVLGGSPQSCRIICSTASLRSWLRCTKICSSPSQPARHGDVNYAQTSMQGVRWLAVVSWCHSTWARQSPGSGSSRRGQPAAQQCLCNSVCQACTALCHCPGCKSLGWGSVEPDAPLGRRPPSSAKSVLFPLTGVSRLP
jgi:hypothetical protein